MTESIVIGALLAAACGVMLLRIRLNVALAAGSRLIALSLGRHTGFEADLDSRRGAFRIAGIPVYRLSLDLHPAPEKTVKPEKRRKPRRTRRATPTFADLREIIPQAARAFWNYLYGIFRASRVEVFWFRLRIGFDSPDRTGIVFGAYQAALAAAPAMARHLSCQPVWDGPVFDASGQIVLAVPLYRVVWRTAVLAWQFPIRKLRRFR